MATADGMFHPQQGSAAIAAHGLLQYKELPVLSCGRGLHVVQPGLTDT